MFVWVTVSHVRATLRWIQLIILLPIGLIHLGNNRNLDRGTDRRGKKGDVMNI